MAMDLWASCVVPPRAYGLFEDMACLEISLGMMEIWENSPNSPLDILDDSDWDLGFGLLSHAISCAFSCFRLAHVESISWIHLEQVWTKLQQTDRNKALLLSSVATWSVSWRLAFDPRLALATPLPSGNVIWNNTKYPYPKIIKHCFTHITERIVLRDILNESQGLWWHHITSS